MKKKKKKMKKERKNIHKIFKLKPSEELRQKLLEEEFKMRRKQPSRWTKAVFRIKAIRLAKARGDISEKEYERQINKYYREREKERERILRKANNNGC